VFFSCRRRGLPARPPSRPSPSPSVCASAASVRLVRRRLRAVLGHPLGRPPDLRAAVRLVRRRLRAVRGHPLDLRAVRGRPPDLRRRPPRRQRSPPSARHPRVRLAREDPLPRQGRRRCRGCLRAAVCASAASSFGSPETSPGVLCLVRDRAQLSACSLRRPQGRR
jgi:hypothetical protein